jgi:hypothetical protein
MIDISKKSDAAVHFAAVKLAHECRSIIQACLREDEGSNERLFKLIRRALEVSNDTYQQPV